MKVKSLSRVRLFVTPWTAAYQAPPSMGFSRQEYWRGVPLPSPTASQGPQTLSPLQSLPRLRIVIFNELFEVSVGCLNSLNRDLKKERKWWEFLLNSFGGAWDCSL